MRVESKFINHAPKSKTRNYLSFNSVPQQEDNTINISTTTPSLVLDQSRVDVLWMIIRYSYIWGSVITETDNNVRITYYISAGII